jgi:hypothetical protein
MQEFVGECDDRHRRRGMVNMTDAGRELIFCVAAVINGHDVIQRRKLPDNVRPDEFRAADDENPHRGSAAQTGAREASDPNRDEHRHDRFRAVERRRSRRERDDQEHTKSRKDQKRERIEMHGVLVKSQYQRFSRVDTAPATFEPG